MGPPTDNEPDVDVRVSIWPGTREAGFVGGVSAVPTGYICASRVSRVTFGVICGYVGSYGTAFECICLKALMQTSGSSWFMRVTSVPGVAPRDTSATQGTGFASGMIFAPPLTAFGSLNIRVISAAICAQCPGAPQMVEPAVLAVSAARA